MIPDLQVMHILDDPLVEAIRRRASLAEEDEERLAGHVVIAEQPGTAAVLVTWSTVSPCVDAARCRARIPVFNTGHWRE